MYVMYVHYTNKYNWSGVCVFLNQLVFRTKMTNISSSNINKHTPGPILVYFSRLPSHCYTPATT